MKNNVVICDANHGGLVLLDEYSKYTSKPLFFYDIYNKLTDEDKKTYSQKYNVSFIEKESIDESYTTIAPVHMRPVIHKDFTHHEFTAYLVNKHRNKYNWNFRIIQVTGVKAKTTVTSMIKDILSDYNVLVLNSSELSYHSDNRKVVLKRNLSITPSSIITALNIALEEDLLDKIDYFIAEVSLGVIPNESIGVLTNIVEDYPIADDSLKASAAKRNVFSCDRVICMKESFDKYYDDVKRDAFKISLSDADSDMYTSSLNLDIKNSSFTLHYNDKKYDVTCFALTDFYVLNILFAISVGLMCDMCMEDILLKIDDINTIDGRTSYKKVGKKIIIEEINPGLNTTSIKKSIENIKRLDENFIIVLGGDYGITCEEIDETKLVNYLKTLPNKIVLTGNLGRNIHGKLNKSNITYIPTLNKAINEMIKLENNEIIEVIYRSEYAKNVELNI
ncbi:coenzyme F430 synthase [Methanosphaera sp. BMS]|uniref:coenzyme F430 synthase n=1 Tax=Methanosphaera sp. BMS TaxID=1789762 RepID=UPI000DC1D7BD|nr:coenzyme F430 synthase [Methanosphaera sp. BMS]AWX33189.1 hypothetical protein AW729_08865 [Methanosphaera sp. BMS]